MKSNNIILPLVLLLCTLAAGCGGSKSSGSGSSVPAPALTSITVTPSNPDSAAATIRQFTALGRYSNNTTRILTDSVVWSSSNTSVATISTTPGSRGLTTSIALGTTTISAVSGGITGTTLLTVTSASLASLALSPTNPTLSVNATLQFTVAGTYSDSSTQIPSVVTWSSSSTPVATISNSAGSQGLAASFATGTTLITALSGSVTQSTLLTVIPQPPNALSITVNGSNCSPATSASYINKPCVRVTVCSPGTSSCREINDILLDTGSFGLRIFKTELVGIPLSQVPSGTGSLAECVQFADGSSHWGPVMTADVKLGLEPAVTVPIQVIDAAFATVPTGTLGCGTPDASPSVAGYKGILGVGLFAEDCGNFCVTHAASGIYYKCSGTVCTGTTAALSNQVQNPVSLLPHDNNGIIMQLPAVPSGGAASVTGQLVLGIGTQANNTIPSGVTAFPADGSGQFITVFNNITYNQSFIDSGSNALFFTAPSALLTPCTDANGLATGWYCPVAGKDLTATNKGYTGTPSNLVAFHIDNADILFSSPNLVFGELGGSMPSMSRTFDWGLPFYFGRNVYVGIEGKTSGLGTGPYWAY